MFYVVMLSENEEGQSVVIYASMGIFSNLVRGRACDGHKKEKAQSPPNPDKERRALSQTRGKNVSVASDTFL